MNKDLTKGNVTKTMLIFAAPMILGNLLQQCYNIADSLIVGRFLGADALGAVGSAYTLMTFLTSVLIGLCMGSGSLFSFYYGKGDKEGLHNSVFASFRFIAGITIVMNIAVFAGIDGILKLLKVPASVYAMMREYVFIIFMGIVFVFLYNYFAYLLRAMGDSVTPLLFLGAAALLNIGLDLLFIAKFSWGIKGAAVATVIAQVFSGLGIGCFALVREASARCIVHRNGDKEGKKFTGEVIRFSMAACVQQSVMNFGILMIQGLVNSFGTAVMAAFAAAVKIDTLAYMPAQEFANAYSIFISQNHGAGEKERIKKGTKSAIIISVLFCIMISCVVYIMSPQFMQLFVRSTETEIIKIGTGYLRIEGAFYWGIGLLFLLYGYFRGNGKPEVSVVLTVISLGTRVLLAYMLAPLPQVGVYGIWWAIPIGWILADLAGALMMCRSLWGTFRTK
ncbi:MAG: MATE family efflux transporter [Lachnospiraceae bacterium]|nr:MATE family efflux transporter [Lachnospiraceae bacterium]